MKKLIVLLATVLLIPGIAGCRSIDAGEDLVAYGKQAITNIDWYVDGQSSIDETRKEIDALHVSVEKIFDLDKATETERWISVTVFTFHNYLEFCSEDEANGDEDGLDDKKQNLIDIRNTLAGKLKVEKRYYVE